MTERGGRRGARGRGRRRADAARLGGGSRRPGREGACEVVVSDGVAGAGDVAVRGRRGRDRPGRRADRARASSTSTRTSGSRATRTRRRSRRGSPPPRTAGSRRSASCPTRPGDRRAGDRGAGAGRGGCLGFAGSGARPRRGHHRAGRGDAGAAGRARRRGRGRLQRRRVAGRERGDPAQRARVRGLPRAADHRPPRGPDAHRRAPRRTRATSAPCWGSRAGRDRPRRVPWPGRSRSSPTSSATCPPRGST